MATCLHWYLERPGNLQHVVGGTYQLDEAAAEDNPEISGEESDPNSEDKNTIDGSHTHCYLIDSSDLSNNFANNQHAISLQVNKQLQYDLPKVLPILHGISSILDARTVIDIDEPVVTEFQDVLMKLSDQLQKVELAPSEPSLRMAITLKPSESTGPYQPADKSTHRASGLATRKHVLPPSPEAKQKRKKSHGTL